MKYMFRTATLLAAFTLIPALTANAQEGTTWFGDTADGRWLAGIKYGQVANEALGFEDADAYTLVLGYQFAREVGVNGSSNLEFEFTDSDEADRNTGFAGDNWDLRSYGLYLTYQSPGTVYFKGKLGVLYSEISSEANNIKLEATDDASLAYGAGVGIVLGANQNINLELDYTAASGDNDISLVNLGGYITF
jgi:hypothetical protein